MSGVVKIEINESVETLKKLLKSASTAQEKERLQTIYWLKTQTVETAKRNWDNVRTQSSNSTKMVR